MSIREQLSRRSGCEEELGGAAADWQRGWRPGSVFCCGCAADLDWQHVQLADPTLVPHPSALVAARYVMICNDNASTPASVGGPSRAAQVAAGNYYSAASCPSSAIRPHTTWPDTVLSHDQTFIFFLHFGQGRQHPKHAHGAQTGMLTHTSVSHCHNTSMLCTANWPHRAGPQRSAHTRFAAYTYRTFTTASAAATGLATPHTSCMSGSSE